MQMCKQNTHRKIGPVASSRVHTSRAERRACACVLLLRVRRFLTFCCRSHCDSGSLRPRQCTAPAASAAGRSGSGARYRLRLRLRQIPQSRHTPSRDKPVPVPAPDLRQRPDPQCASHRTPQSHRPQRQREPQQLLRQQGHRHIRQTQTQNMLRHAPPARPNTVSSHNQLSTIAARLKHKHKHRSTCEARLSRCVCACARVRACA